MLVRHPGSSEILYIYSKIQSQEVSKLNRHSKRSKFLFQVPVRGQLLPWPHVNPLVEAAELPAKGEGGP